MPRRSEPHPLSLSVGRRVHALREARGLTLEQVASEAKVGSKGHLSDLEHGLVLPTIETLEGLAQRLGVQVIDLIVDPRRDLRGALVEASSGLTPSALAAVIATARRLGAATAGALAQAGAPASLPFIEVDAPPDSLAAPRGVVPFLPLDVAAHGYPSRNVLAGVRWVAPRTTRPLALGNFVARVTGRSMEPEVPEGSYVLFASPRHDHLLGRTVLVRCEGLVDEDTGASYTLKRFDGERVAPTRWQSIRLTPANPTYRAVSLDIARGDQFEVAAEVVEVLGAPSVR